jgi:hypothetical protein
MQNDPGVVSAFAKLRFLVLDEADRLLDRAFEDEMRVLLSALPCSRQTLLSEAPAAPVHAQSVSVHGALLPSALSLYTPGPSLRGEVSGWAGWACRVHTHPCTLWSLRRAT